MAGIEKLEYGEAANDGKGYDLRNGVIITDNNFIEIVMWITGGLQKYGQLNKPLPISRGGSESGTAAGARKNFGIVQGPNGEALIGNNSLEVYNDKYTVYGRANTDYAFTRVSEGVYKLEGVTAAGTLGFKQVLPADELGNVLIGAVAEITAGVLNIKTHPIVYTGGKAAVNTAVPADIPPGRFLLLNMK